MMIQRPSTACPSLFPDARWSVNTIIFDAVVPSGD